MGDPSAPGGAITQQIKANSTAERPFWEAWIIKPTKQYTDVAEENGRKGDDFWSRPGRTGSATFYEGIDLDQLKRMGFEVGNVLEAIGRPSTYNDPSDERVLRDARKSNTVTRSF